MKRSLLLLFLISSFSCFSEHKKFYIKTVGINSATRLNWYYHSYITSLSSDFVEVENQGRTRKIFEARALTNIGFRNDTILFEIDGLAYRQQGVGYRFVDSLYIKSLGYHYSVDITGAFWNGKNNRIGRLGQMDKTKPHYVDSDGNQ